MNRGTTDKSRTKRTRIRVALSILFFLALSLFTGIAIHGQSSAVDPGLRHGPPGAGGEIDGLTVDQGLTFEQNLGNFAEVNTVKATGGKLPLIGLGPTFDSNSCASCHAQPAIGGSSPAINNLFSVFQGHQGQNTMPFFETLNGPTVIARFPFQADGTTQDGGVHRLFEITGRDDGAGTCNIPQPDFVAAAAQNNLILRQTTPMFGAGLVEIIQNNAIISNMNANSSEKLALGISGHPNYTAQDGTIGRFGWKAQARSLMMFAAGAYNIEEGVTNEFFPSENNAVPGCLINPLPEDHTNFDFGPKPEPNIFTGDPERFAMLARFFKPPTPAPPTQSTINGQNQFNNIGCVYCHTTSFTTPLASVNALSNIQANLFSDLLVHHMGPCLADNVVQEAAKGDEFRTAPLWGLGQRIFFLHDGRTANIVQAVEDHFCPGNGVYPDSEANAVINGFNALSVSDQQDLINFLRSL